MEREIKNAIIRGARLSFTERNILELWLDLDYGNSGQGFGGYALYLPKSFRHHSVNTCAGHFIYRTLEIAGVTDFDKLIGRTIRVDADFGKVYGIGHIVKDNWFYPDEELKRKSLNDTGDVENAEAAAVDNGSDTPGGKA